MNLIERLAARDYEDWRATFPGGPMNHGFGPWAECIEDYRTDKIARMDRIIRHLAAVIGDVAASNAKKPATGGAPTQENHNESIGLSQEETRNIHRKNAANTGDNHRAAETGFDWAEFIDALAEDRNVLQSRLSKVEAERDALREVIQRAAHELVRTPWGESASTRAYEVLNAVLNPSHVKQEGGAE